MLADGCVRAMTNVRFLTDLKRYLLFGGMLDYIGCNIKVEGGVTKVLKGSLTIMRHKTNGLYILDGNTIVGTADAKTVNNARSWHLRLGHIGERGPLELSKQNLLCKYKVNSLEICEE